MIGKIFLKILNSQNNTFRVSGFLSFDKDDVFEIIYNKCKAYTMTSIERMYILYNANRYVLSEKIACDIVEYGVWKGGRSILYALTLKTF